MSARASVPLRSTSSGIWSVAVKDLVPDFCSYTLYVDGVKTLDPRNPLIKQGNRGVDNMFSLPGKEAAYAANQAVPHGQIRQVWYRSSRLGTQRRMHIYTPPQYDSGSAHYPVLYLLHGGGDEDSGWSTIGRAGFILDNLLARGDAQPMLVVMPNGSSGCHHRPLPGRTDERRHVLRRARRTRLSSPQRMAPDFFRVSCCFFPGPRVL